MSQAPSRDLDRQGPASLAQRPGPRPLLAAAHQQAIRDASARQALRRSLVIEVARHCGGSLGEGADMERLFGARC